MKYIKRQPHQNTCGVVAIVNALRSFGVKVSYEKILKEAGGLKKVGKRGMTIPHVIRILKRHNLDVLAIHVNRQKMLKYAKHPKATVLFAYVWGEKVGKNFYGGPHIVMVQKNGKSLNVSKQSRVIGKRWRDTRLVWKMPPITLVCIEKKGGAR